MNLNLGFMMIVASNAAAFVVDNISSRHHHHHHHHHHRHVNQKDTIKTTSSFAFTSLQTITNRNVGSSISISSSFSFNARTNTNYQDNEDDDDDLTQYFKTSYKSLASSLSCDQVTTMMMSPPPPSSSSTTSSSSSKTTTPLSASSASSKPLRQELFTNPIIPALYERLLPPLWKAGLRSGGPQVEYENAMSFLVPSSSKSKSKSTRDDERKLVALDLSCGTGFVARRMSSSSSSSSFNKKEKTFKHVFALDYSKEMLNECISTITRCNKQNYQQQQYSNLYIIQGDASCLPFHDDSIDVIHWGAAMHCVPNAEKALEEVYRVLKKDGGRVYITTFLRPFPNVVFRFFTVEELRSMARNVGFGNNDDGSGDGGGVLEVEGRGVYGILRATK